MRSNSHAGCGGRAGETHREQSRQGAPVRPNLRRARPRWSTSCAAAHLLRDLDDAAQVYPDAVWPAQIADALRELIHDANLARDTRPARDRPTRSATR